MDNCALNPFLRNTSHLHKAITSAITIFIPIPDFVLILCAALGQDVQTYTAFLVTLNYRLYLYSTAVFQNTRPHNIHLISKTLYADLNTLHLHPLMDLTLLITYNFLFLWNHQRIYHLVSGYTHPTAQHTFCSIYPPNPIICAAYSPTKYLVTIRNKQSDSIFAYMRYLPICSGGSQVSIMVICLSNNQLVITSIW